MSEKREITKELLDRQNNYFIINSCSDKTFSDSLLNIKTRIENSPMLKAITTISVKSDLTKPINTLAVSSYNSEELLQIKLEDKSITDDEILISLVNRLKYAVIITEKKNLTEEALSVLATDYFRKKSIDILMHQNDLFISPAELNILEKSVKQAENKERISTNISFIIYPKPFVFDKDMTVKLFGFYGEINAIGIILSQLTANNSNSVVQYNFLTKKINGFNLNDHLAKSVDELLEKIKPEIGILKFIHNNWSEIELSKIETVIYTEGEAINNANEELLKSLEKYNQIELITKFPKMLSDGTIGGIYFKHLLTTGYEQGGNEQEDVSNFSQKAMEQLQKKMLDIN